MKVMKFGGTSVGSIESLLNLRDIVNAESKPVVVVVSAMGGFTNQLLAMCEQAQQRDISCMDTLEAARTRHHDAIDGVVVESMRDQVHATIDRFIDESLKPYYLALATNPHMPVDEIERVCDAIVAHGEILSSAIVTGMFEDGVALDGPLVIETDEHAQFASKAVGINGLHGNALISGINDDIVAVGIMHGLGFLDLGV